MIDIDYSNTAADHVEARGAACCCAGCLDPQGAGTASLGVSTPLTDGLEANFPLQTGVVNSSGNMVINYFFNSGSGSALGYTLNPAGFNAYEQGQFEVAHEVYESLINVEFQEVFSSGSADFIYNSISAGGGLLGVFNLPNGVVGQTLNGGFASSGTGWDETPGNGLEQGGYGFVTIIHEMGHGFGLGHPHDTGGGSSVFPGVTSSSDTGDFDLNQGIYTTMSYIDGWETNPDHGGSFFDADYGWQGTPMAIDIAVLQDFYGANMTTNTGDNVYLMPDSNGSGTFWECIWDAGGDDTIQYNGSRNVVIDLRAATLLVEEGGGGWISWAEDVVGGYTIAHGVEIERAVGGAGNDAISSNEYNNFLTGNGGADTFFFYQDGPGDIDTVTDFQQGIDRLDVDDFLPDVNPLSVLADITFQLIGGNAVISYQGESIIVEGITSWSQISQSDFVLT